MEKFNTVELNNMFVDNVMSTDSGMNKIAQSAVEEFTRRKLREDGFMRKILPPVQVSNSDLTRYTDTELNGITIDMETNSPAAYTLPYGAVPNNRYIKQSRYRVLFDRIETPRATKDVSELRTSRMDVRQVLSDNMIKDLLAEEDGKFMRAVNTGLGAENSTVTETNAVQNKLFDSAMDRVGFADARAIMPTLLAHLSVKTILINNVTVLELEKWGRDMLGGDLSDEIARNGYALRTFFGVQLIVTIKRDLVPDGTLYMFAEPKFLGKFFVLEDVTMAIKKEFYLIEFFAYAEIGGAVANMAAVTRARFAHTFAGDTPTGSWSGN